MRYYIDGCRCVKSWQTLPVWRYLRLTAPYLVMLGLLLVVAWLTRTSGIEPPLIDSFSWRQLLAHFVYLQDVLRYGNLSAGTWYLCIDMQFTALFLLLFAVLQAVGSRLLGRDATPLAMSLVLAPLGVVAAWHWNRHPEEDQYVTYYLAPLVLGALVAWTIRGKIPAALLIGYLALVGLSLCFDEKETLRLRLVIALVTGAALLIASRSALLERLFKPLAPLGRISYSLFLIHYLVNWLVIAALAPYLNNQPLRAIAALVMAFATSLVAAVLLYVFVEKPTLQWVKPLKP